MDARSEVLARVEGAGVLPFTAPRTAAAASTRSRAAIVEQFAEYAAEYRADVVRCPAGKVAQVVAGLLQGTVLVPDGFPAEWIPGGVNVLADKQLSASDLDSIDAVLTTCAVAVAETGTVVLDHGPGQGRRALSLVPDHHVVIVEEEKIVDSVEEAVAGLEASILAGRPLTWISGPSATSDIELNRVEGVHGPRRLDIVVVSE